MWAFALGALGVVVFAFIVGYVIGFQRGFNK